MCVTISFRLSQTCANATCHHTRVFSVAVVVFMSELLETRLRQDVLELGGLRFVYARPLHDRDSSVEYRAQPQGQLFFLMCNLQAISHKTISIDSF